MGRLDTNNLVGDQDPAENGSRVFNSPAAKWLRAVTASLALTACGTEAPTMELQENNRTGIDDSTEALSPFVYFYIAPLGDGVKIAGELNEETTLTVEIRSGDKMIASEVFPDHAPGNFSETVRATIRKGDQIKISASNGWKKTQTVD